MIYCCQSHTKINVGGRKSRNREEEEEEKYSIVKGGSREIEYLRIYVRKFTQKFGYCVQTV